MITPFSALQLSEEQKAYSRFYPLKDAEEEGSIYLIHHEALYLTPYMRYFMDLIRGIYQYGEKDMDEKRSLIKVKITDVALAEKRVSILMGDKVEPRKEWINENVVFTLEDSYKI